MGGSPARIGLRGTLGVALAALCLIPAQAAAAGGAVAERAVDPGDGGGAAGYWTPERMRAADGVEPPAPDGSTWAGSSSSPIVSSLAAAAGEPLTVPPAGAGRIVPGAGDTGGAGGASSARAYTNGFVAQPASPAIRMHGRVFFETAEGGNASCSGTAIRSNRHNLVMTAGHCVHGGSHEGDWVKHFVFVPAYVDGIAPFGFWRATRLYSMPIWVEFGDPTGDIGLATMRPNQHGDLQRAVGARGITFGRDADQRYTAYGYPANPEDGFDGENERFCRSRFSGRDPITTRGVGPKTISMRCDMTQGASGGSWVTNKGLASSLVSYGYPDLPGRIFGPYLGSLARQLYEATQVRCKGRVATIVGTAEGDRIDGTRKRDVIIAGAGADVVRGLGKRDLICGGRGADRLDGGAGADNLLGGGGDDELIGGTGEDTCGGGQGRNRGTGCERRRKLLGSSA